MTEEHEYTEDIYAGYRTDLPPALIKSFEDHPWSYAMGLRDGRVISFEGAELLEGGKWIHLPGPDHSCSLKVSGVDYSFDRGLDVRISDIVWVTDAPSGS